MHGNSNIKVIFSIKWLRIVPKVCFYVSRVSLRMAHNYLTSLTGWSAQYRRSISRGTGTGIYLTKLRCSEVRIQCSFYVLQLQSASTRNHYAVCPDSEHCVLSMTVFLNRRAAAQYRALASIIPSR